MMPWVKKYRRHENEQLPRKHLSLQRDDEMAHELHRRDEEIVRLKKAMGMLEVELKGKHKDKGKGKDERTPAKNRDFAIES